MTIKKGRYTIQLIILFITLFLFFKIIYEIKAEESLENKIIKQNKDLTISKELQNTAKYKVNDMIFHKYFAHINPFGDDFVAIFRRFKIKYFVGGEILAKNYKNEDELVKDWLNSPTHRDIIKDKNLKNVGCYSKNGYTACHFKR